MKDKNCWLVGGVKPDLRTAQRHLKTETNRFEWAIQVTKIRPAIMPVVTKIDKKIVAKFTCNKNNKNAAPQQHLSRFCCENGLVKSRPVWPGFQKTNKWNWNNIYCKKILYKSFKHLKFFGIFLPTKFVSLFMRLN